MAHSEFAALIEAKVHSDGALPTQVPGLFLYRHSSAIRSIQNVYAPALGVVAQGAKEMTLGEERYTFDANRYLVLSVDLPLIGQVKTASRAKPYLGIRYNLDVSQVAQLQMQGKVGWDCKTASSRGLYVSEMSKDLQGALMRLLRLLDTPKDIPVLAPLLHREILYRLICGEQGGLLAKMGTPDGHTSGVLKTINWLKDNFRQPFELKRVTREAKMSPSALYTHFRKVTNMTPLQFQKQLRLQEARRLMLAQGMNAASAGYDVGYRSPSQFNREYTQQFGLPPVRDVERLRLLPELIEP
jgi:AraC-like DNA-binding protein